MKKNESVVRRPWEGVPRRLPMKYHSRAMVPAVLVLGDVDSWEYLCDGGERVRFEYLRTCNNTQGYYQEDLEKEAQKLYKMPFAAIEAAWMRRIGRLDGWWHIVHMVKANATEGI